MIAQREYTVTMPQVDSAVNIRIEGVSPTGNSAIRTNPLILYISDGAVVVESPSATQLSVYTLARQLYTSRTITAGTTRVALPLHNNYSPKTLHLFTAC